MARHVGLEVIERRDFGVPMYLALRKTDIAAELGQDAGESKIKAALNANLANGMIGAVDRARDAARTTGERFAIFGLAIPGLFAPLVRNFDPSEIVAYVDDNSALWGTTAHGRPISSPDELKSLGVSHVALSMSPAYQEPIVKRVRAMGMEVYH